MAQRRIRLAPPGELSDAQILGKAPIAAGTKPGINVSMTERDFTRQVAQNIPPSTLYRYNDNYITLSTENIYTKEGFSEKRLDMRSMSPERFVSWIENHVAFWNENREGDIIKTSIGATRAKTILASDALREHTPRIREIAKVRLPVWANEEKTRLTIAPPGYDPKSEIYTMPTLDWNHRELYDAKNTIIALSKFFKDFPFAESGKWQEKRSVAAFMALLLGQFLRHCIPLFPIVIFTANQPGSGKTLLAAMGLAPVAGNVNTYSAPKNDEDMQKALNTFLLNGSNYVLLDNVKSLASTTVEMYATSPYITGRILQTQTGFEVENRMQIIITGNGLKTSQDIVRRSLFVSLAYPYDVTKRKIDKSYDISKLRNPAFRKSMLESCWYLVASWSAAGCPRLVRGDRFPSFETFAEIVGSVLAYHGFADPFNKPDVLTLDVGNTQDEAMILLLSILADSIIPGSEHCSYPPDWEEGRNRGLYHTFRVADIVDFAKANDLADIISSYGDVHKSIGHQLRKLKGRIFTDKLGRSFEFGRREDRIGTAYTITILSETAR